jgi:signal transduction histidine kinase/DNA-binding response OmpR family regulator
MRPKTGALLWYGSLGCILLAAPPTHGSQSGRPLLRNYTYKEYHAELQNWDIVQDARGVLYFANNAGVLEYGGAGWRVIELPDKNNVQSLATAPENGRIYVGAIGDFGYLAPDAVGQWQFISLKPQVADGDRDFHQIRKTHAVGGAVFFQAAERLFRWSDGTMKVWAPKTRFHRSFVVHGRLFVQQWEIGLMEMKGDSLVLVPRGEEFAYRHINAMLPYQEAGSGDGGGTLLIGTAENGLFLYDGASVTLFSRDLQDFFKQNRILDGAVLPDGGFVFGTSRGGVAIIDRAGSFLQHVDKSLGLQDNQVHSVFPDAEAGIWLGLENNLARLQAGEPFSIVDETLGVKGNYGNVFKHRGVLYACNAQGLFFSPPSEPRRNGSPALRRLQFRPVSCIKPAVWSVLPVGETLLAASGGGVYLVQGDRATCIRESVADRYRAQCLYRSRESPDRVYVGLAAGLASLRLSRGRWLDEGTFTEIHESVRTIVEDQGRSLWLGTSRGTVLRVDFRRGESAQKQPLERHPTITRFGAEHGLPPGYIHVADVSGRVVFATANGILLFDEATGRFHPDPAFASVSSEGPRDVVWVAPDREGNVWLVSEKAGGADFMVRQPDGTFTRDTTRLRRFSKTQLWYVYPDEDGVVWFVTPDYNLRYDPGAEKERAPGYPALIQRVTVGGDTVVYGGAPPGVSRGGDGRPEAVGLPVEKWRSPELPYSRNAIRLEFAVPSYEDETSNEFQYYLEGFDEAWSAWTNETQKDYTNLPEGKYRFRVRARNAYGHLSPEADYPFRILAPWYRTGWAYLLYLLGVGSVLYGIRRYELNRIHLKNRLKMGLLEAEKLKELDTLKSRFFAKISHEFRTPLSLIMGPVDRLIHEAADETTKGRLALVKRNARRLLRLINQLLDLSRLESGSMQIRAAPGDLVEFVRTITQFFAPLAEQKRIALRFQATEENLEVYFDRDKVEKIVTNLVSNALKFTLPGGSVEVVVGALSPAVVEIRVADTGVGIAADHLGHVFDRFYQVDSSPTREHEGSGIGLALAKELVELHRGEIRVTSEESKGTTFVVRLPRGKDPFKKEEILVTTEREIERVDLVETPETSGDRHPRAPEVEDQTIVLVVDDHGEMRAYIREVLEAEYEVLEAKDGAEGLSLAREAVPDLVVSDVMMPRMNGYELCQALKNDEKTSHIPVILLTARAAQEDKLEGLEKEADAYLTKPFDSRELAVQARNLIQLRQTLRERFGRAVILKPSEMSVSSVDEIFLDKVLAAVEAHLDEEDFGVEELGREVGMSRSQIHRKLRALTNQTPTLLIRSIRLERGAELLRQKAGSVAEIAYRVGFGSQAYFTKCFRERFGSTPTEYARNPETPFPAPPAT